MNKQIFLCVALLINCGGVLGIHGSEYKVSFEKKDPNNKFHNNAHESGFSFWTKTLEDYCPYTSTVLLADPKWPQEPNYGEFNNTPHLKLDAKDAERRHKIIRTKLEGIEKDDGLFLMGKEPSPRITVRDNLPEYMKKLNELKGCDVIAKAESKDGTTWYLKVDSGNLANALRLYETRNECMSLVNGDQIINFCKINEPKKSADSPKMVGNMSIPSGEKIHLSMEYGIFPTLKWKSFHNDTTISANPLVMRNILENIYLSMYYEGLVGFDFLCKTRDEKLYYRCALMKEDLKIFFDETNAKGIKAVKLGIVIASVFGLFYFAG